VFVALEKNHGKKRELRELEKRYKLFYEYAPLPYQSLDEDVKIIDVNQAWLDFFGYDKEEVIGKCFGEFLILKSREMLNSKFSHFKEVGIIQDVEYEIVKKNGIHRIIWLDGRIEYDKNGNFKQAHCFFKDITERKKVENQLISSEAFLSNVFTSIQDGISVLDKELNIIKINPVMEKWYSHSMPMLGRKCYEVYHERSERCEICPSIQALRTGEPAYEVVPKIGPNQKTIGWLDLYSFPLLDEGGGNIIGVIEYVRDISERVNAEQKLKESEEKFRNIAEQSFMSIYIMQDGLFKYRNQRATDVSGYNREDIKNWKPYEYAKVIHPEDREFVLEQSRKKQEGDYDVINRYKYRLIKKSGEIAWIDNFSKTINYKGRTANLVITEDITEKIVAEQKLKESEEKYKYLFENAQIGLYWSRISDGKFLECNDIFAKLFGYETREDLLEDYVATEHYVYPNQRNEILDAIRKYKEVRGFEILVTKRDGTPIWLSISARMSEKEKRIEGAAIDITNRKKAEQELIESEERYRKAYDKADFYKDLLAHDVSNIFNNINASIQLIELWKEDSEMLHNKKDMIEIIQQQLERGSSLVSNVRKLSEIEEGDRLVKSVDVINVIKGSIEDILSRFQDREIEIKVEKTNEIFNVKGGDLLIDAFENILINSATYNESETIRIWVKVSEVYKEDEKFVRIEFKDNGIGIIDDRKKAIFKRNYNKDRSTGGMGIGLSLVKTIINSFDGQVWVDNRIMGDHTKGSNFIILLKQGYLMD